MWLLYPIILKNIYKNDITLFRYEPKMPRSQILRR